MRYRSLQFLTVAAALAAIVAVAGVRTTRVTAQQQQQTETVELFSACNNVSLTWPTGTPTSQVAAGITPAANLIAIWRFNNAAQTFQGYSAQFPEASDLRTVNLIDAVFVCMSGPGTMTRPFLPPGG